jgi:hypothetical protein
MIGQARVKKTNDRHRKAPDRREGGPGALIKRDREVDDNCYYHQMIRQAREKNSELREKRPLVIGG